MQPIWCSMEVKLVFVAGKLGILEKNERIKVLVGNWEIETI